MSILFKNKFVKAINVLAIVASFLVLVTASTPAKAQSADRGLILRPAILELEADRGGSYDFNVTIENDSSTDNVDLQSSINTFEASGEEGIPAIKDLPTNSPFKKWVNFDKGDFSLAPNKSFESKFRVSVPTDAQPGSYFFAVTYATSPTSSTNGSGTKVDISRRIAALLFVTVKGKVDRTVSFDKFQTNKGVYDPFFDSVQLDYKISTQGNVYLKPSGNIFVGSSTSSPDNTLNLNPNDKFILPNSARNFTAVSNPTWHWPFLSDSNKTDNNVDITKPWFGSKKFTASILYANGNGELEKKETQVEVFFFPWKLLLTLLLLVFVVAGGFLIYKYNKKAVKAETK
jgi:hypothetical protein